MPQLELTKEQLERILKRKAKDEASKVKVSPEDLFLAEFGYYYGWDAMQAVANNSVTYDDALVLLAGARKVWYSKMVDTASVMYTASAAAQAGKKAKQVMTKGLKDYINLSKADN